jgi:sporulation-control protein spo0M
MSVPSDSGDRPPEVYQRVRLATFEVNLYIPRDTPERIADQVVVLLNDLDLRRRIEETIQYYLRTRSFLKMVTAEVDE